MNIAEAVAEDKALRARRAEIMAELGAIDQRLVVLARPPWIDALEVLAVMNAREAADELLKQLEEQSEAMIWT
jgi:hypothetical protein